MKVPTNYRAELRPLKPGSGIVQVKIMDNGDLKDPNGAFSHILNFNSNAVFVPSERELTRCGLTIDKWMENPIMEWKHNIIKGETDRLHDIGIFTEGTTEKQFDYLQAKSLVEIINKNYHHFY